MTLLFNYFKKTDHYKQKTHFGKPEEQNTRYMKKGPENCAYECFYTEDNHQFFETQWMNTLAQLSNAMRLVRAEDDQDQVKTLYGMVHIGAYTRFHQLDDVEQKGVGYPGTNGKSYEIAHTI